LLNFAVALWLAPGIANRSFGGSLNQDDYQDWLSQRWLDAIVAIRLGLSLTRVKRAMDSWQVRGLVSRRS